jgi:hypothetical protein
MTDADDQIEGPDMTDAELIAKARQATAERRMSELSAALITELANALAAHQWRTDMENAPRDGTPILCWRRGGDCEVFIWSEKSDHWVDCLGSIIPTPENPTHWRPLTPPEDV